MSSRIKHFFSLIALTFFIIIAIGSTGPSCFCCGATIDRDDPEVREFTDAIFCDSECFLNHGFYKYKCSR